MYFSTSFAALLTMSSTLVNVEGVPTDDKSSYDKKCPSNQFYYQERDCCLPNGGPDKYYPVPKGKQCPNDYYWHHEKECCVPKYEKYDAPKCSDNFVWTDRYCEQSHHGDKSDGKYKHDDDKYDNNKDDASKYDDESGDQYDDKKGDKYDDKGGDKYDDKESEKYDDKVGDKDGDKDGYKSDNKDGAKDNDKDGDNIKWNVEN